MNAFLQQVAEHYAATPRLEDLCFVFPNRRSGKFFEQRLAEAINGPAMMPRIVAMVDFLSDLTERNQVGQLEAMLVLYKAYCQVMGDNASPMDAFVRWASLIINDFNDADMNLVDVQRLYANLHDLREISTDYLSDDLKRDIERVLNVALPSENSQRFWREHWQPEDGDTEVRHKYFSLWERLYEIYRVFHQMLADYGLRTVGGIYRDAAHRVKLIGDNRLPLRVVMVGFSSLSVSEMAIFKALQQRGVAHFWWDNALDVLSKDTDNPAGKMVRQYAQLFPMPKSLTPETLAGTVVEAVAVPSVVGQAKWAFHRVDQWLEQGFILHPDNAINTAIVLPDESLFMPLINSVSDRITNLNVTMGYSMRYANIVSLMHLVARAHRQATRRAEGWTFYREDVKDILSHPIIKAAFTRQAMQLSDELATRNDWNIPARTLCNKGFATLFTPLSDVKDTNQVLAYIDRLADFCNQVNDRIKGSEVSGQGDGAPSVNQLPSPPEEGSEERSLPLQSAFIDLYVEALDQLKLAFAVHGVPVTDDTIFYLIDRLTQAMVVPFEGEPLRGLQIMGLQETRSLDFENLMILSMNERIFPRRHGIASFIPDTLRAAFYMLTSARQEAIAAYDFYRLIGRAKNVVLVYSTANEGGGEASRFICQLKLLYGDKVRFADYRVDTKVTAPSELPIEVDKANVPMYDYVNPSASVDPKHARCLSHSSIAEYIDCPLKFYLHHVEHLTENSDKGDFMDYGTFGNIIHDALQQLYYPPMEDDIKRTGSYIVTRQMIEQFKGKRMQQQVLRYINKHYLHNDDLTAPIQGEALILQETLETFVYRALEYDLQMLEQEGVNSIEVLECEQEHKVQLDFSQDGVEAKFNFTYKPDRVDRVEGKLRMVDYKTGGDKTQFKTIDNLFEPFGNDHKRCKAIAQLLLYCNAWHLEHPQDRAIQPVIYKLRAIDETGVFQQIAIEGKKQKYEKQQLTFEPDSDLNREFKQRMGDKIAELLNRSGQFAQATDDHACQYCRFADFCRR